MVKLKLRKKRFNNRIDVYEETRTIGSLGEDVIDYAKSKTIWCEVSPYRGTMNNEQANTIEARLYQKITTNYEETKHLNVDNYFMLNGRRLNIMYFLNPYESNIYNEFYCLEVQK